MLSEIEARWTLQSAKDAMSKKEYEQFTNLLQTCPERVSFMKHDEEYFAEGHTIKRIIAGPLTGLEGYIVRINRDRKFITKFGQVTVSIDHAHKEVVEDI